MKTKKFSEFSVSQHPFRHVQAAILGGTVLFLCFFSELVRSETMTVSTVQDSPELVESLDDGIVNQYINQPINQTIDLTINQPINHNQSIRFDSNFSDQKKIMLRNWVNYAKDALTCVYGELPLDNFVSVIKASNDTQSGSAVPWGEVRRFTPAEVILVINPASSLTELKADWTIYHELSHLLIPYDANDSRWFSEGLASYYQNIIQARIGMFDEQKMWQKLYEGFERAHNQQNYRHQPLSQVSDNISQNRNYMRIYWSGALYWLKADILLRTAKFSSAKSSAVKHSNVKQVALKIQSLDTALQQLKNCCYGEYMSAQQIVEKLDQLTGSQIFSSLFTEFSNSLAISDYQTLLIDLGIHSENNKIILIDDSRLSKHRKAIFNGVNKG